LVKKLTLVLDEEISQINVNEEEGRYLMKYQSMVLKRCEHFLNQVDAIATFE
jgi:serine/threonine-protein kinase HipA